MSIPQVGQGAFAVVPTFKGFRKAVTAESDASAKAADTGFRKAFSKTGTESGKQTGQGFKKAFEGQSTGFAEKATRELEKAVSSSAAKVSAARLKEQDAAGKVRVAESQLAEAREKYASDSSQVIRAQERMATAARQLDDAQDKTKASTNDLRSAQQNLASAADRAGDQLAESGRKSATRFSSGFSEVFKGSFLGSALGNLASDLTSRIGYAIGSGIREGFQFALGTIDIASDLSESVNAVQVSYGDIADQIFKLGETSAKTFGLSKRDLNSYAVQFSAFSKGIAGPGGDVAGTFQSILGRATDFASVMNLEVSDALGLFQSGLAGETEPLRKYGIDLSAAAVEAYALANGIGEGRKELTESEKQQARYGALLSQTSLVQGDFANTSSELANQNRINAATWDDLQAKMGTAFLPIAQQLATVVGDDLLPAIAKLVDEHGPELAQMFEDALPALVELAQKVLPELPGLFEDTAATLPAVIDAAATLAPLVVLLSEHFGGLTGMVSGFLGLIGGNTSIDELAEQMSGLPGPFGDVSEAAYNLGQDVARAFAQGNIYVQDFAVKSGRAVGEAIGFIQSIPGKVGEVFAGAGTWLVDSGKALIRGFIDGINQMFKPVGDAVSGILNFVDGFFPNSPAKRGPFSGAGWTNLGRSGSAVMEQFTSGMARPDFTGRLTPALTHAASITLPGAASKSPSTLVLVDQDGQLIGRMRVEAGTAVQEKASSDEVTFAGGKASL